MAEKLKFFESLVGGSSHLHRTFRHDSSTELEAKAKNEIKMHTGKGRNNKPKSNKISRWLFCIWSDDASSTAVCSK